MFEGYYQHAIPKHQTASSEALVSTEAPSGKLKRDGDAKMQPYWTRVEAALVEGEMKNDRPAAYVTGVGVVSPIGVGRKAFWASLLANESGVGPITLFDARDYEVRIAAECTAFDPKEFMDRKAAQRTDRFAHMGLAAAKLALEDANAWGELEDNAQRVGLILGSGLGGVTSMEDTQRTIDAKGPGRVNPFAVTKIMTNSAAAHIGIQLGVEG